MESKLVVDARGLTCPMPIVKTKKAIDKIDRGEILEVHATDPGAKNDLTAWVNYTGHELVKNIEEEGSFKFWIKKA